MYFQLLTNFYWGESLQGPCWSFAYMQTTCKHIYCKQTNKRIFTKTQNIYVNHFLHLRKASWFELRDDLQTCWSKELADRRYVHTHARLWSLFSAAQRASTWWQNHLSLDIWWNYSYVYQTVYTMIRSRTCVTKTMLLYSDEHESSHWQQTFQTKAVPTLAELQFVIATWCFS